MEIELYIKAALALVGGLGLFLLGMRKLSDGLQTIAGSSLKRLIAAVTGNRFMAVGVGMAVTTVIQSSSITTALVVGFVNSGIMSLSQSIGVIMGTNIGTTITGWVLVLKVGAYGLPLAGAAAMVYIFSKRETTRYIAMTLLGLGLVFLGLEIMKDGLAPLRNVPEFKAWFHAFQADSYLGVLKCAMVGCILTMVVQSSSATLGITIVMASQGLIPFETAAALVLGENIGTTITALLAGLGGNINARRASWFHSIFNILGALWVTAIFPWYLMVVEWIVATFMGVPNVRVMAPEGSSELFPVVVTGIATVHTLFNIVNTLIFLPFTGVFGRLLAKLGKDADGSVSSRIARLDDATLDSPFAALEQVEHELNRMGSELLTMMGQLRTCIESPAGAKAQGRPIFASETKFDTLQHEVTSFLTKLLSRQIGQAFAAQAQAQLRICDELESVSDYITQILKLQLRLEENGDKFDTDHKESLLQLHDKVTGQLSVSIRFLENPENPLLLQDLQTRNQEITAVVRSSRNEHWKSLAERSSSPLLATCYSDILVSYRKIKEHMLAATEAVEHTSAQD
jgi:phosphate:Na+ symporter